MARFLMLFADIPIVHLIQLLVKTFRSFMQFRYLFLLAPIAFQFSFTSCEQATASKEQNKDTTIKDQANLTNATTSGASLVLDTVDYVARLTKLANGDS